jgi:hypothetical protein
MYALVEGPMRGLELAIRVHSCSEVSAPVAEVMSIGVPAALWMLLRLVIPIAVQTLRGRAEPGCACRIGRWMTGLPRSWSSGGPEETDDDRSDG